MLNQPEILKNNAHRPAQVGDLPLLDVGQGEAVNHHPALRGDDLSDEQLDHRGLAAAGGAHHKNELPVLDLHGQAVEGVGAVGVFFHYICQSYHAVSFPAQGTEHHILPKRTKSYIYL